MYIRLLFIFFVSVSIGWGQTTIKEIDAINAIDHKTFTSDLKKYEVIFQNNLKAAATINYEAGVAKANERLSIIYFYLKDNEKGMKYAFDATLYYEEQEEWQLMANSYSDIGFHLKESNLDLALSYFRKALAIGKAHDLGTYEEKIFNNYGVLQLYKTPRALDSALFYHEKAYEVALKNKQTYAIPFALNNMAVVYSEMKEFDKAFKILDRSDSYRKNKDNTINWADNLAYRADIFYAMERYDSAIFYYEKSLVLAKQSNFMNLTKFCLERLSNAYEKQNNATKALTYYKELQAHKDSILTLESAIAVAKLQEEYNTVEKERSLMEQKAIVASQNSKIIILTLTLVLLLVMGYMLYRIIKARQNKIQQNLLLEKMEAEAKIQKEKLRISRDLHDNIGSQLTYVISSLDNLNYIKNSEQREKKLNDLEHFTKNTLSELRETVWTIKTSDISLIELMLKIKAHIQHLKLNFSTISFNVVQPKLEESEFIIPAETAVHCYRVTQEVVNNAIKYANADTISVVYDNYSIIIEDNGKGFDSAKITHGNGLKNMHTRMEEAALSLKVSTQLGVGTQIRIEGLKKFV